MERLLDYFIPDHYDLEECIWRDAEKFKGRVVITGHIQPGKDCIKLHAVGLEIDDVEWAPVDDENDYYYVRYQNCQYKHHADCLEIPFDDTMLSTLKDCQDHNYVTIKVNFHGQLNRNMQGCYLSTYNFQGEEQRLVATQFESHYAREAFPCIDEPAAKATFGLTLIVPDRCGADVILANTLVKKQDNNRFEFQDTPKMSTYLLAWVIGPLKEVSTFSKSGIKVSSYAALNQPTSSLDFANETAARALDYYESQFGIPYPLAKFDQVALPDFEAGAMENWGLVTFRESTLLADKTATLETKQSVAVTVTHELSHQWFGNLVTMAWWDDLWLNESFATMMEYYCTDALYPEFHIWQDFFTGDCLAALRRDSLPGVQSVQQAVQDPAEIATLFDSAIVYAKGARLMLMLSRLLGQENFLKGLRDYFTQHRYKNTVADDLWRALQPYADFDVQKFMHAWISQPGFPALQRNGNADVSKSDAWLQQRFLINGTTDDTKWPLPEVKDDMSGHYLLDLGDREFHEKLAKFNDLDTEQKLRLLVDRLFLAKAQIVSSASLLDLLPKFADEASASIWSILSGIIGDLKLFCPPESDAMRDYQRYLLQIFRPQLSDLSLDSLSDLNAIQVRDALLDVAYYAKDDTTLRRLSGLYADHLESIDPELRNIILVAKYYYSENELFDPLLRRYQSETDPEIKSDLLFVLASFSKIPAHLDRLLALLHEPEIVRPQDHIFLYVYLLRNYRTRLRTLEWLTQNWDYIEQLTGDKSVEEYARYASALIRTPEEAKIFYDFFDQKADHPILRRTLKIAHVEIDARLSLIRRQSDPVRARLAELVKEK